MYIYRERERYRYTCVEEASAATAWAPALRRPAAGAAPGAQDALPTVLYYVMVCYLILNALDC